MEKEFEKEGTDNVPFVYVGPTVRNKIKQYTVYIGGAPKILTELIEQVPAINALFVSVDKLQECKKQLQDKASVLSVMYQHVENYFKNKE